MDPNTPPPGATGKPPAPVVACPRCFASVSAEQRFCGKCGSRVEGATVCSNCDAPVDLRQAFCTSCGVPLQTGASPFVPTGEVDPGAPRPETLSGFSGPSGRVYTRPSAPSSSRSVYEAYAPSRPRNHWIVPTLLVVAVAVLAGLMVSGYGDTLMGRHWYAGANAPYTNDTIVGVNDSVSLTGAGLAAPVNGSLIIGTPPVFLKPGSIDGVTIFFTDDYANRNLTCTSILAYGLFAGSTVVPDGGFTLSPGASQDVTITFTAPSHPGIYYVTIDMTGVVS